MTVLPPGIHQRQDPRNAGTLQVFGTLSGVDNDVNEVGLLNHGHMRPRCSLAGR
jgi:hypothetical protein